MTEPNLARPPAHPRRLAFLGTPDVAVPPLRALVDAGVEVALVVSRPDRRRGRGGSLTPSPVKAAAIELGLPVTDELDAILDAEVDLAVVVAYGRLIPTRILERVPMVNLHFSALPRWRGAAPVERALLAGDPDTAVCLMDVDVELDTGDVRAIRHTPIEPDDTLDSLRGRLVSMGSEMLVDAIRDGIPAGVAQSGEITHAAKIDPAELHIDWRDPAVQIDRLVRLGGAWTTFRDARLKVHHARPVDIGVELDPGAIDGAIVGCGEGALELFEVQPEGRARQSVRDWRNGARPEPGEMLGGSSDDRTDA